MWAIHLLKNEALHNRSSPPGEALQTSSTAPPANCPSKRRGDGVTYILPNDRQDVWIILRYVPMTTPPEKNTFWHLWRPFLGRHRATNFQRAGRGEGGAGVHRTGPGRSPGCSTKDGYCWRKAGALRWGSRRIGVQDGSNSCTYWGSETGMP
jgi:hypothetical protein